MGTLYALSKATLKRDKQTLNLETATVKVSLHNNTLSYSAGYEYFNEVQASELATANGYTQGGLTIANKAFSLYGDDAVKFDADDPDGWTVTSSGFTFRWWVLRVDTGNSATSPIIAIYDYGEDITWVARTLARTIEFNSAGIFTQPHRPSSATVPANIATSNVTASSATGAGVTLTAAAGTATAITSPAESGETITFRFGKLAAPGIPQHADIITTGVTAAQFEAGKALTVSSTAGSNAYFYYQSVSSKYGANPAWSELTVAIPANAAPTFVSNENLTTNPQTKSGTTTNSGWYISYDYGDAESDAVVVKLLVKTTNSYIEADWDGATTITPPISGSVTASDNYFEYEVTGKSNSTTYYYWLRLEDASNTGASGTTSAVKTVTTLSTSPPVFGGAGNAIALSATTYQGFTIALSAAATDPEGGLVLYEPNYKKSTDGTWTVHTKYHSLLRASISEANASDAATAATLANALKQSYEAHRISTREHSSADNTNAITAGNASAGDTGSITALANELKLDYNAHRTQTSVHLTNDSTNTISSADATDLATAYTLLNEIKADYNLHMGFSYTVSGLSLVYGTYQVKLVAKDPDGGVASSETDTFDVYNLSCTSAAPTSVVAETTAAGNNGSLTAVGTAGTNSRTATKLKVSVTDSAATAATDASAQINEYTSLSIATGAAISQAVTGLNLPAGGYKIWLTLGSAEDGYQSWSAATAFTVYPVISSIDVTSPTTTGYTIECDSNVEAAEYTQLEVFISTTSYAVGTVPADTNDAAITSARDAAGAGYKETVSAGATLNSIIGAGGAITETAIAADAYYSYIRGVSNGVTGLWAKGAATFANGFNLDFNETGWTTPTTTYFDRSLTGTATATCTGGFLQMHTNNNELNGSICIRKEAIAKAAKTRTAKIKVANLGTNWNSYYFTILQKATQPVVGDTALTRIYALMLNDAGTYKLRLFHKNAAGTVQRFYNGGWDPTLETMPTAAADTVYPVIFETTTTQWRITIKTTDGTSTILAGPWVDWSATQDDTNPYWLISGDLDESNASAGGLDTYWDSYSEV